MQNRPQHLTLFHISMWEYHCQYWHFLFCKNIDIDMVIFENIIIKKTIPENIYFAWIIAKTLKIGILEKERDPKNKIIFCSLLKRNFFFCQVGSHFLSNVFLLFFSLFRANCTWNLQVSWCCRRNGPLNFPSPKIFNFSTEWPNDAYYSCSHI